jgi:ferrochelatase
MHRDGSVPAVLVVSFGGPEQPADVRPFLENVTRGRGVPPERLDEVEAHYQAFGGRSPINDQVRALIAALRAELDRRGLTDLPIHWGNRNWHPYVEEAVRTMAGEGITEAYAFVTSAFSSYSGCRQYREDLERACSAVGEQAPAVHKLRVFFDHPGFVEPLADRVIDAVRSLGDAAPAPVLLFCAHSIPVASAATCDYERQLRAAAALVAERVGGLPSWELVWQSRSGPPQVPWLEPDVGDRIRQLAEAGVRDVVLVPLGFVSDHLEVLYDLDTVAVPLGSSLGMRVVRAATVGTDERFVAMIADLVEERRLAEHGGTPTRPALSTLGVWPDRCAVDCCPAPVRPAGAGRPTGAGGRAGGAGGPGGAGRPA